jgi:hypothetical protein
MAFQPWSTRGGRIALFPILKRRPARIAVNHCARCIVRVAVAPQPVHTKTRVSGAQSFGRATGSTRVNRIGALQSGHFGVSVTIDDVIGASPSRTTLTLHLS